MGGAVSQFEETDWSLADGGLYAESNEKRLSHFHSNDVPPTIDGAPPTLSFQILSLQNCKSSSFLARDFDVLDGTGVVCYSTHAVPGTLTCFDVQSPFPLPKLQDYYPQGMGSLHQEYASHTLRVHASSRKTWTVYRYHVPLFKGQHKTQCKGVPQEIHLYKTALITVNRTVAVAARYGPPNMDAYLLRQSKDGQEKDATEIFTDNLSHEKSQHDEDEDDDDELRADHIHYDVTLEQNYQVQQQQFYDLPTTFSKTTQCPTRTVPTSLGGCIGFGRWTLIEMRRDCNCGWPSNESCQQGSGIGTLAIVTGGIATSYQE